WRYPRWPAGQRSPRSSGCCSPGPRAASGAMPPRVRSSPVRWSRWRWPAGPWRSCRLRPAASTRPCARRSGRPTPTRSRHSPAARGYAVAAIDYRLAPAAPYPAALEDVRAAVAYLAAHAAEYDLDRSRVVLLGRSAGGHLALLAGYTSDAGTVGGARIMGIVA